MVRKLSQAEHEAAEWIFRFNEQEVSEEERRAFQTWLTAKPENESAYCAQKANWTALTDMRTLADYDDLIAESFFERWMMKASDAFEQIRRAVAQPQAAAAAASLAVVLILGAFLWRGAFIGDPAAPDHATQIAEIREVKLEDGSIVTLGALSSIDVDFADGARRVRLLSGEAFFDIAKDPDRPFFVAAGDTMVRVVGTKFDVRHGAGTIRVSVLEGIVEVNKAGETLVDKRSSGALSASDGQALRQTLTAGQRIVSASNAVLAPVEAVEPSDVALWRKGRLSYVEARLGDVVADMNRYYDGEIIIADASLKDRRFTAAMRADQIDVLIDMMASDMSVDVEAAGDNRLILRSQAGAL